MPWNLAGALAAMNPSGAPHPYKIAPRSQPAAAYLSAVSLESAIRACGRREVVTLDGVVVFDPRQK